MPETTTAGESAVNYFRSADFQERDGFRAWRDLLTALYPASVIRNPTDKPFVATVGYRTLPQVRLSWGTAGPALNTRLRGEHNDDFSLFVNLGGAVLASQHGREFELGKGDAYLMAYSEPGSLDRWTDGAMVAVRVANEALAPFVRNAHDNIGRLIPSDTEGLRLLARYVQMLDESEPLLTEGERALAATHVLDVLALALGAAGDARELAGRRGARAALLKTVRSYVERNAGRGDLSLETVATRFGISPRSMQKLFEHEDATFTEFVHERRLLLAHRMVANPRFERLRISEIAFAAGFGDLSYFNRSFRRRFGLTPSDVRNARPD